MGKSGALDARSVNASREGSQVWYGSSGLSGEDKVVCKVEGASCGGLDKTAWDDQLSQCGPAECTPSDVPNKSLPPSAPQIVLPKYILTLV